MTIAQTLIEFRKHGTKPDHTEAEVIAGLRACAATLKAQEQARLLPVVVEDAELING